MMSKTNQKLLTADEIEGITNAQLFEMGEDKAGEETEAEIKTNTFSETMRETPTARVCVYRQPNGGNGEMELVGKYEADKYELEDLLLYLRDSYGGGDYRLMLRAGGKLLQNRLFSVAAPLDAKRSADKGENGNVSSSILAMIDRMNDRIERALTSTNTPPPQKTTMETLQELQVMKEVMGLGQPQQQPQQSGMDEFIKTISVLKELGLADIGGGGGASSDGMDKLITMGATLVDKAMKAPQQLQQPQRMPPNRRPQMAPNGPTPEQIAGMNQQVRKQNPIQKNESDDDMMLQMGIMMLLKMAKEGGHERAVDLIWSQIPESKIKEFLCEPESINHLMKLNKEVGEHIEWFKDLAEHMKATLGMPSKFAADYNEPIIDEEEPKAGESGMTPNDFPKEPPVTSDEVLSMAGESLTLGEDAPIIAGEPVNNSAEDDNNL